MKNIREEWNVNQKDKPHILSICNRDRNFNPDIH